MNSYLIASLSFLCIFGGALSGLFSSVSFHPITSARNLRIA
jgi:hypothetical protein